MMKTREKREWKEAQVFSEDGLLVVVNKLDRKPIPRYSYCIARELDQKVVPHVFINFVKQGGDVIIDSKSDVIKRLVDQAEEYIQSCLQSSFKRVIRANYVEIIKK